MDGQPRTFRLEVDLLKRQLCDRLRALELLSGELWQLHARREHKRAVDRRFGRIDYLVNNAGLNVTAPLADTQLGDWNAVLSVNLTAPMRLAQAALPYWIAQGSGAIVNVGSRAWLSGSFPAYTASKAGLVGLTRSFAVELGAVNVRANAVAPGFVDTGFTRRDRSNEELEVAHDRVRQITPLGRIGLPDDVANAVNFLLSDEASFITGEVLNVSGGAHLAARSTG